MFKIARNFILASVLGLGLFCLSFAFADILLADGNETVPDAAPTVSQSEPLPNITAPSAVLMEATSGQILFEKDSHKKRPPASITKIMTMLLAMEALEQGKIHLDDKVIASDRASMQGGSQIWLEVGEEMSLNDLMKSIAVVSANDASVAVAEHIAGAEEVFVDMMNKRAKELGMQDTHFVNCTGLPAEGHLTSAYDVAVMSRELIKHPKVHEWFTIWIDYVRDGKNILVNTNRLIKDYKGCDGLKTGYTEEAGYCLSATAKRDNLRLIAVVMGLADSKVRFSETAKLLDYGFRFYAGVPMIQKDQVVAEIKVLRGKQEKVTVVSASDASACVKRGREADVKIETSIDERVVAPVKKGQKLGKMAAYLDGQEIASVDLVAKDDVERGSIFQILFRMIRDLIKAIFG